MPIRITCPACDCTFRVGDHLAGRRGRCPECGEAILVPDEELPRLDPIDDSSDERYERRRRRPPPSPRDHLPAWRRVGTGYLIQQGGATFNLVALALFLAAVTVFAEDPADPNAPLNKGELVSVSLGMVAAVFGLGLQAVGRFVSANTPVRAPRAIGWVSALATAVQVPVGCLTGFLFVALVFEQQQGNAVEPLLAAVAGLGIIGWGFLLVTGEACHAFAVGSVGRVLRANGVMGFGRGLGVFVVLAGFVVMASMCALGAMVEEPNPNDPAPVNDPADAELALIWQIGVCVLAGLYLLLDVVLLQSGRSAIARIAAPDDGRGVEDDWR